MPRFALLCSTVLLLPLACGDPFSGDDLPGGAFTSGPGTGVVLPSTTEDQSGSDAPPPPDSDGSNILHSVHIQPIWDANCIDGSCHDADGPQAGLDLETAGALDRMCDVGFSMGAMPLLDCAGANPLNSYVLRKIQGTHLDPDDVIRGAAGGSMPPAGIDPLTSAEIDTIELWINGGANG